MKRLTPRVFGPGLLLSLVAVACLGLSATACNVTLSPYAAKVGGSVITPGQLDDALSHATSDTPFDCLLKAIEPKGRRFAGAGTGTYDTSFADYLLTNLIDVQIADETVAAHHLTVTPAAESLASQQVSGLFQNELLQTKCGVTTTAMLAGLGTELRHSLIGLDADDDLLAAQAAHLPLTTAGITAYEKAHRATSTEACLDIVLVSTAAIGKTVETQLRHGTSFASEAAKYDTSATGLPSNGSVGCFTAQNLASSIGPTITTAVFATKAGGITEPLSYNSRFLIFKVAATPLEPAISGLQALVQNEQTALEHSIERAIRRTPVSIDAQYGTWRVASGSGAVPSTVGLFGGEVVKPSAPASIYLLNDPATLGKLQKPPPASTATSQG